MRCAGHTSGPRCTQSVHASWGIQAYSVARTPERRRAGLEDLQAMAESANELSQLLFARNVRRLAGQ